MKKSTKIAVGVATLWPFIYMFLFMAFFFSTFMFAARSGGEGGGGETGPPFFMVIFIALHLFTMLWSLALTAFYMVNVFRNDRVDKDKKVLWAVVLFLGNMFAMPIYWYLYIWKEAPPGALPVQPALASGDTSAWVNNATTSQRQQEYAPPPEPPNWRD